MLKPTLKRSLLLSLALLLFAACSSDSDNGATDDLDTSADDVGQDGQDIADDDTLDDGDAAGDVDEEDGTGEDSGPVDPYADVVERDLPERPWSVYENGPFRVGFRAEKKIAYEPRGGEGSEDENRRIRFVMWYPTHAQSGKDANYINNLSTQRGRGIFDRAPVAQNAGERLPLLVFSHGNSSLAEQSYFMTEYFATHGWLVISPDHTFNTFYDTPGSINANSAYVRPQDLSLLMDWLEDLPEDDPLYERIDWDRVAVAGHSFGGYTALAITGAEFAIDEYQAACESGEETRFCGIMDREAQLEVFREGLLDERVLASIPQSPAGALVFQEGLQNINVPTLLMTAGMDTTLYPDEEGNPIWELMQKPIHQRIDLLRAGHFTYSNMCELFSSIDLVKNDGCNDHFIDPEDAHDIINAYSMAFLRHVFDGDDSNPDLVYTNETPWPEEVASSVGEEPNDDDGHEPDSNDGED